MFYARISITNNFVNYDTLIKKINKVRKSIPEEVKNKTLSGNLSKIETKWIVVNKWMASDFFTFFIYLPVYHHFQVHLKHYLTLERKHEKKNTKSRNKMLFRILKTYSFGLRFIFSTKPLIFSTKLVSVIFSKRRKSST